MGAINLRIDSGIAWIEIDLPGEPINKISTAVGHELDAAFDSVAADSSLKAAIIISRKPGCFIAGADIEEFVRLQAKEEAEELSRNGQQLMNRIAGCRIPVVAAINGSCLGGGFELSLACTYRVATTDPKTVIGLPEIQLGILPGAGGCQRLPRLVGVRAALDMILAGKTLPARRAFRAGMVDELVHPAILDRVALAAAQRLATGWRPARRSRGLAGKLLDGTPVGRAIVFSQARKQVLKKTGGNYPAPLAALDTVAYGLRRGIERGLEYEARRFGELAVSDVSRKLVQIFFATTELKKDPGVSGPAPEPRKVRNLAIVGAGFMGSAIGGVAALKAKVDVRLKDSDWERVARGVAGAKKLLDTRLKRRRLTRYEHRELTALISGGPDFSGFERADLVIEAVFEDLEVKHTVFRELETHVRHDTVLASNTSTIPITRIAEALSHPERMVGMHFFSPVEKMPLLEVIITDRTSAEVITTAVHFGRRMGKTVIVVRDCPGFWVNRILAPYMNEAGHLLSEGVPVEVIDRAMTKFGFPVGPITLLDEVGLDVASKAAGVLHQAFGERLAPVAAFEKLTGDGRLGRKSGKGFFVYEKGKKQGVDPAVYRLLGVTPDSRADRDDVLARLTYVMLNEAARALDERVVRTARDGDIGAVFGIGYPPFRGGPLRYIDDLGAGKVVEVLRELEAKHGPRFEPAERLVRMAETGGTFH